MVRKFTLCLVLIVFVFASAPAFAGSGKFSIGVLGGGSWSTSDSAIWGRSETHYDDAFVYGGRLMYWFPQQIGLELAVDRMELDVKDSGRDLGTLNMTPVMLLVKAQGMPRDGRGFTGHLGIGGGINLTDFDENPSGDAAGFPYTIETDNAFVYEIGAGADYFITRHFSLSLDGRWMGGEVESTRKTEEVKGTKKEDLTFYIYNFQLLLGARVWF